jgi:hypothetical protein
MILSDISTRKRHDTLWRTLGFVLQDQAGRRGTVEVAGALQTRLGFPKSELNMVMTWLQKVAPLVPEASHTGECIKVYGRTGRRWVWSPRLGGAVTPAPDDSAARLPIEAAAGADYATMTMEELQDIIMRDDSPEANLAAEELERRYILRANETKRRKAGQAEVPEVDSTDW